MIEERDSHENADENNQGADEETDDGDDGSTGNIDSDANGEDSKGTEFTEFADPKAEARFKRVYGHMKANERTIVEQGKLMAQLVDRLEGMENQGLTAAVNTQIDTLNAQKEQALEDGDLKRVTAIDGHIMDLKLQAKPVSRPAVNPEPVAENSWITPDREMKIIDWASEVDNNGDYRRPWAQDSHPKYRSTLATVSAVISDPDFENSEPEIVLAEVDKRMSGSRRSSKLAVLPGNDGGRPNNKAKTKLTVEEKNVAASMNLTPEAYAKAKEKWS